MSSVLAAGEGASTAELRALLAKRLAPGQPQPRLLSFAQERLWFLHQMDPGSPLYNMQSLSRLRGELNTEILRTALGCIVARHEILRTRFVSADGEPRQVVEDEQDVELSIKDLSGIAEPARDAALQKYVESSVSRPFNLTGGRPLRLSLIKLGLDDHALLVEMHHIVSDEWSFQIFFRELRQFYTALLTGQAAGIAELDIQYGDYSLWQREWLEGPVFAKQLSFWRDHLSGTPQPIELPFDHPRRSTTAPAGAGEWRSVGLELTRTLKALAANEGVTLFMLLLAAFKALLYRYTRQPDIIVGSPVAGRTRLETENLIGFFINTLPLRSRVRGEMTFREFLAQVRETTLAAYSHQDLPFEKLVEALQPERTVHATPFVNVMFLAQPAEPEGGAAWPGLEFEFLGGPVGPAKFDLTLSLSENGGNLVAAAQFNTELFEAETIHRFLEHYQVLLEGIVAAPSTPICELPLMSRAERETVLIRWNNTRTHYPRESSVHQIFEEQAGRTPEAVAVVFRGTQLSYRALNERANRVAHRLRKEGVKPGSLVPICAERSLEMIVGLLGILKAGAAYAPIDPTLPERRISELLETLGATTLLVSHSRLLRHLPARPALPGFCLEAESRSTAENTENLDLTPDPKGLAYISFTSGSTGKPKGVCVPHRAIVRLVKNVNYIQVAPADVFLQLAPIAFDASTFEIWGALLNGARLVVFPPNLPSLSELGETIRHQRVTTAWFTSGLFNQLVDENPEALKSLRQVITGGDVLSPPHVRKALRFLGSAALMNGYGPTENATFSTTYRIPAAFDGTSPVPIGRPISNSTCYILDEHAQPVPIGVPGELCVGGDGLAAGYLQAPELTRDKFVPNPFCPGECLYRTGDLVRFLPEGDIQFLGRFTEQIKIRGFRVEPGEIESALLAHPRVERCVVTTRPDPGGSRQLLAYFVARSETAPASQELQTFLRERLPDYMVPAFFVPLDELPLSPNGKVDASALPSPGSVVVTAPEAIQPRNEMERLLQEVWEDVLEVRPIGVHDSFFALGGHSLLAMRLLAKLEKKLERSVKVKTLFQNPTIAQLAAALRGNSLPMGSSSIVAIQPNGQKPPLYLVHGAGGGMLWGYSNLGRHLGPGQPLYAFRSRGLDGQEELTTIDALADAYLADLRAFQPQGPYCLGGYCFGGVVAHAMACRLHDAGEEVPFLALINSTAPNSSYCHFRWTPRTAIQFVRNVLLRSYYVWRTHPEKVGPFLSWKTRAISRRLCRVLPRGEAMACGATAPPEDWLDLSQYSEQQQQVWDIHLQALLKHQPRAYPGSVTLFRTPVHLLFCSFEAEYGWKDCVRGGVTQKIIPGAHETIMEEPGVQNLAKAMNESLAQSMGCTPA